MRPPRSENAVCVRPWSPARWVRHRRSAGQATGGPGSRRMPVTAAVIGRFPATSGS